MPPRVASPCAARKQRQLCVEIVQIKWQLCKLYQLCLELMFQQIQRRGKCSPSEFRLLHKSKSNLWPAQSCANCGAHWTPTHMATHTHTEHIVHTHTQKHIVVAAGKHLLYLFPFKSVKFISSFVFALPNHRLTYAHVCVCACVAGHVCPAIKSV